ncbi:enoyl-CoA hydratase/isomerase family protein [Pontibacter sp. G13]|uniref:enoyl-CoA hydratase/isomerase family protein n=1 Tax=Pontibacter sp. G13 TaxID=3074898 RepID=UPI00288B2E02|nr:enoyl-CoA hydratase/isomerase family protein [Pontibacter sp. G13]WNJ16727.1 enoyl-CoA hydratase/isomerase family protein [Pontibacter sp. G13]
MNTLSIETRKNYQIVQLDRGKANPMNHEMIRELRQVLQEVQASDQMGGIILTGKPGYFTAGLDVKEMYDFDEAGIRAFFQDFRGLIRDLVEFDKPLIAAITGQSPAGGCILAICSDYRVMAAGNYRIGLNEIPVGLILPEYVFELYSFWLGRRKAYHFLMEGKLHTPDDALEAGLLDEVVPLEEVLTRAEKRIKKYLQFNPKVWQISKRNLRTQVRESVYRDSDEVMEATLKQWWSEEGRALLGMFVASLKK